jgi:hypothetical protein
MSLTWNMAFLRRLVTMASAAYLREQAELLTAMSRATIDLGMAGRLRAMASEFQTKATEQEDEPTATDLELATHSSPVRKVS